LSDVSERQQSSLHATDGPLGQDEALLVSEKLVGVLLARIWQTYHLFITERRFISQVKKRF